MRVLCWRRQLLFLCSALSLNPLAWQSAKASNLTGESEAILTVAHRHVEKREFTGWSEKSWKEPSPAKLGDKLPPGTQLGTGDRSWAQLSWPNVCTRIWQNSVVALTANKRIVYLLNGEMLFNLDKNRKDKTVYEIWTPLLQARVRGTTFILQSGRDYSRLLVLEGALNVLNRLDKSEISLEPGMILEIRNGKAPLPRRLPDKEAGSQSGFPSPVSSSAGEPGQIKADNGNKMRASAESQPRYRYSEAEIEQKAAELSVGDPQKKEVFRRQLRERNPIISPQLSSLPKSNLNAPPAKVYSQSEIELKADQLARGNMQERQRLIAKFEQMNRAAAGSKAAYAVKAENKTATVLVRNYGKLKTKEELEAERNYCAELAPLGAEASNSNVLEQRDPLLDYAAGSVQALPLFRNNASATNLYLADQQSIRNSPLLRNFNTQLYNQQELSAQLKALSSEQLPAVLSVPSNLSLKARDKLMAEKVRILKGPEGADFEISKVLSKEFLLPGQYKPPSGSERNK